MIDFEEFSRRDEGVCRHTQLNDNAEKTQRYAFCKGLNRYVSRSTITGTQKHAFFICMRPIIKGLILRSFPGGMKECVGTLD